MGADLGGDRRQGSGHGDGWRARGGERVGPGVSGRDRERKEAREGPGGGLFWRGDGAPWARAPASSRSSLRPSGRWCTESREFVEVDYAQGEKRGSGECGMAGPRRGQRLARSGGVLSAREESRRGRERMGTIV